MTKTRKRCRFCNHADRDDLEERLNSLSITTDNLDEERDWPSGVSARHLRNHMGEIILANMKRNQIQNVSYAQHLIEKN